MKSKPICSRECLFNRFFTNSHEAMFITSRVGLFHDTNAALNRLLGYGDGELTGRPVALILDSENERDAYQRKIEVEGVVHDYGMALRRKDGSILFCLIDAIVWKEEGRIAGYHGIVRTRGEVLDSFLQYFNQLKEERRMLQERQKRLVSDTQLLSRYLTDDLLGYIRKTGRNPLETERRRAAVLFFDIRNSTGIAEQVTPESFAEFLSDILTDIMDLIYGCRGSVNKLLGDGLLATFGCPLATGDDTWNAVDAALKIQEYLATFNDVRPPAIREPLRAGIGIATGLVFTGVIGSVRRQEYAVLGDPVNVASRLQALTKQMNEKILIDGETWNEIGNRISCRKLLRGKLRGKTETVTVFAVDPENEDMREASAQ